MTTTLVDTRGSAGQAYERIPVASLRVGQQLPFAIHDEAQALLLARGSVITPKVLRGLHARKLAFVTIDGGQAAAARSAALDSRDCAAVAYESDASHTADTTPFEEEVARGRALIESFETNDHTPYDDVLVNELLQQQQDDTRDLAAQFGELAEGTCQIHGTALESMVTNHIASMARDLDASVSVAQIPPTQDYWSKHALEMSVLSMGLAARLGLAEPDVRLAGLSALLADLGMRKVPAELLELDRPLSWLEFFEVQKHPIHTLDMTERVRGIPNRTNLIVYQVHERPNGKGYPRNRDGSRTYILAKIIGIVDAYLAMVADRPHRRGLLPHRAMAHILREAKEGRWDLTVTRGLLQLIGLYPVGSYVLLSDDSLARVVRSGGDSYTRPRITITHNADGAPQKSDTLVDLAEEDALQIVRPIPPLVEPGAV